MKGIIGALSLLVWPVHAFGEILKVANPTSKGLRLYWCPKLSPLKGWHQDLAMSKFYKISALAPLGSNFKDSPVVMYAKACYKPKVAEHSLADFISTDKKEFLSANKTVKALESSPIRDADGARLRTVECIPSGAGNWERVGYCEEGDFYVVFTLSARSEGVYKRSLPSFVRLINTYKR
jgi:hypothetical protein